MREISKRVMQKSARYYSITFLLLGSIASTPEIYAINTITTIENKAFLPVFVAEFSLSSGNKRESLYTYRYLVDQYNSPTINQRALEVALELQDTYTALSIAKTWVDQYPEDVPALFYLAHLSLKAKQFTLATSTLDKILTIDSNADLEGILAGIYPEDDSSRQILLTALQQISTKDNPSVLVLIAGLEAQNGQFEAALKKVNKALKQRPKTPSFIILKANLYFASEQPDQALKWLNQSLKNQDKPDVGLVEVQYYIKQNRMQDALNRLEVILKRWPNNEQLLFLAGITSIDLKRFSSAEHYLQKLVNSDIYQDQAYYYLAVNAERKQDYSSAIELYKATDGNFYTVSRKGLVSIYLKQKNSTDAIRFLTQERISHPHQSSFLYQLQAQLLQELGETKKAIDLLDEALEQLDDDAELIYAQVLLLDPFADRTRLDNALNKLLEIEPNSPTFLNAYAYTLAIQNRNLDVARSYAERAQQLAPKQASILDTLGYVAFLQNDFAFAVHTLAEAYTLSPSLSIGLRYAKALYVNGEIQKFSILCQALLRQYPDSNEVQQLQFLLTPQTPQQVS